MQNLIRKINSNTEFMSIIQDITENENVQAMKQYRQHFNITCYDHCFIASYYCYKICKKFNWDYVSASRASMLHDLFLYDWRQNQPDQKGLHAFTHPKYSYQNACKHFKLNDKEKDIITKHMWPLTFFHFPKYKESFVLTLVDKYCSIRESFY